MPERSHRVRPVDDRHQQRVGRIRPERPVRLTVPVKLSDAGCQVCLADHLPIFVTLQNRIAFLQQQRGLVNHAGCVPAVNHRQPRKAVRVHGDVNKITGTDQRPQDRRVKQDIPVVLRVDPLHVEVVIREAPEAQPVCQRIHRLRAPPEFVLDVLQVRRCRYHVIADAVFHLIELVPRQHTRSLCVQFLLQICHSFVFRHDKNLVLTSPVISV